MKKALISPLEVSGTGVRIVQVCENEFVVAAPLFWVDCPNEIVADEFCYVDGSFAKVQRQAVGVRSMTSLQFMGRFTEEEQLSIVTQTMSNPMIKLWYDRLIAATEVIPGDARLVAGVEALVQHGLITAERAAEVLA